jgi:O-antigen/teichoic acid export membrane protein
MVFHLVTEKSLVLATRIGSQCARILATMIMARLVSTEEYGRFDLILSIPGLLGAAGDLGISRSLVSSHDLPEKEVQDTGIIAMFFLALILGALAIAAGWHYARMDADPRLLWVGVIVAATFIAQNLQGAQMAMLARNMNFSRWARIEALMMLASVVTGITVALAGGGLLALALQQFLAQTFGLFVSSRARPLHWPRHWNWAIAKRFFSFGWKASIYAWTNNVQPNIARQAIQQVVGGRAAANAAVIGATAVGVFGRALAVRELIGYSFVATFDLVLLPLFSRAKDDQARLSDLLLRGTIGVTAFCSFGAAWFVALAPDLIRVFLGPDWGEVPGLLRAMAPALAMHGLAYSCMVLAMALQLPMVSLCYALLNMLGLAVGIVALWYWDMWHFAMTQTLFTVFPTYYVTRWGSRITGLPFRTLMSRSILILAEAVIMCGVMWLVSMELHKLTDQWLPDNARMIRWIPNDQLAAMIRLSLSSLAGALTAWALFVGIDRRNYRDLVGLLIRRQSAPDITAAELVVEP